MCRFGPMCASKPNENDSNINNVSLVSHCAAFRPELRKRRTTAPRHPTCFFYFDFLLEAAQSDTKIIKCCGDRGFSCVAY